MNSIVLKRGFDRTCRNEAIAQQQIGDYGIPVGVYMLYLYRSRFTTKPINDTRVARKLVTRRGTSGLVLIHLVVLRDTRTVLVLWYGLQDKRED